MKNLFFLKKRTKRLLGVRAVVAVVLLASVFCMFVGCKKDDVTDGDQYVNQGTGQKTVINIMRANDDGMGDAWTELADEYMAQKTDVVVNVEGYDNWDTYTTHLSDRLENLVADGANSGGDGAAPNSGGDGAEADSAEVLPTIFVVKGRADIDRLKHTPEDLSGEPWVEKVVDKRLLSPIKKDGKVYGMPLNVEAFGFVYNKEMFEAAGINVDAITTFEDMKKAVQTLDAKIKSKQLEGSFPNLEAVFEFPGKDAGDSGNLFGSLAMSQEGEKHGDEGLYKAVNIEFANGVGLKDVVDLMTEYSKNASAKEKFLGISTEDAIEDGLAAERVAMVALKDDCLAKIAEEKEDVAAKMGIMQIPLKNGKEDSLLVGVESYLCIRQNATDVEKAAAKEFLGWLVTSDSGKNALVNKMNYVPAFTGFESLKNADGITRDVRKYIDHNRMITMTHQDFPEKWGNEAVGLGVQAYLTGEKAIEDVVSAAKKMWSDMRQNM